MFTISPGSTASVGIGSSGAGSTSRPLAACRARPASARAPCRRTAPRRRRRARCSAAGGRASPTRRRTAGRRRSSTTGSVERLRHRRGDVDRDAGLAHATLGGEHRRSGGRAAPVRAAGAGARVRRSRRAARPRGRPTGGGSPRRRSRPRRGRRRAAPAGARRSRARRPRRPRRASGCAVVTPVHVLEPDRAREARVRTPPRPAAPGSAAGRDPRWSSNCAAPGEFDREPRPQRRVGLDDGDVEGRRRLDRAVAVA